MTKEETMKPNLAPKTLNYRSARSRERMTAEEHGTVLHQRSAVKQQKLKEIKMKNERKEDENCTFVPLTNTFKKNPRLLLEERE